MSWGKLRQLIGPVLIILLVVATPMVVIGRVAAHPANSLIISEIKINNDTAGYNEFIELYNGSGSELELADYHLTYYNVTSPGASDNPTTGALPGGLLVPGGFYVLAQNPGQIPGSGQLSLSSLKDTSGFVQLAAADNSIADQVAWSSSKTGLPAGVVTVPASNQSLQKPVDANGVPQTNAGWSAATPTPQSTDLIADNATNVASNAGLAPPQLTELLPSPLAPQTDDNDEFIELYNLNDQPYDLSAYTLQAGTTTLHNYTIPAGTILPPNAFVAFYSSQTHLSLSNTGGQVKLLNPDQQVVDQTDPYGAAPDGQAWAFVGTGWQWTTSPTPGSANDLSSPAGGTTSSTAKATAKATTKKATTTTKKAKSTTTKAKKTTSSGSSAGGNAADISATLPTSSIHPWILAGVGGLALLYAGYEYREDVANKFRQFKANRSARRAGGSKT